MEHQTIDIDDASATSTPPRDTKAFAALMRAVLPNLDDGQIARLMRYRDMLHARNQAVNLTAVRDFDGIERRLILESLRLVERVAGLAGAGKRVLDVGSGGGIPGVVLAVALADRQFTLLDATGKKVAFLRECIDALELTNATAVHGRAEDLAYELEWRSAFDVVTARAVTSLAALLELGLPFLRVGGWMLLPKGPDIDEEMRVGRRAAGKLGGSIVEASFLPDVGSFVETRLVLVRKDLPTPAHFPRRAGIPARSPLGSDQDRPDKRVRRGKSKRP